MMAAGAQSSGFILIVDDTPTNISVLAQTLRQAGLAIRIANDGVGALEQVKREPPALILLDVQMPVMDGFETCRRLKADETTSHIPVIFMTALSDKASRVKGLSLGAVDYIPKPFEQDEVLARVQVHLQLKSLTDELEARVEERTRELQNAQIQLVQQEKLATLGQLIAGVAHEINNPMACIVNNLEPAQEYIQDLTDLIELYQKHYGGQPVDEIEAMLATRDIGFAIEDLPKLLDSMRLSTERIKNISISLRNFSRLDTDAKIAVDIHEGLDSTLVILGHRIKSLGDRPEIEIEKRYGDLPEIECFPSALNQVFMNILANAMDALEGTPNPAIAIETKVLDNGWAIIEIMDNGPGLTELIKQRLFEPLFTTKPIGKGTGLGLSISRQIIVEKHQGRIECISAPGSGCKFVLELPVRTTDENNSRNTIAAMI